jgi:thyrotropin-releasing hormone receptor
MWFYLSDINELIYDNITVVSCEYKVSRNLYLPFIYFTDFAMFYVVPLMLATVLYGFIARILFLNPLPADPKENTKWKKESRQGNRMTSTNNSSCSTTIRSRRQVSCNSTVLKCVIL